MLCTFDSMLCQHLLCEAEVVEGEGEEAEAVDDGGAAERHKETTTTEPPWRLDVQRQLGLGRHFLDRADGRGDFKEECRPNVLT